MPIVIHRVFQVPSLGRKTEMAHRNDHQGRMENAEGSAGTSHRSDKVAVCFHVRTKSPLE